MSSIQAKFFNLIFKMMPADKPGQPHDYVAERKRNDRKPPKPPVGVMVEEKPLNGMDADFITKEGNEKGLVFYIHGGGFTTGAARERRYVTQDIVSNYGYNCISINYRLAPENKWPVHLEDCLRAYEKVMELGYDPKDIVFMGESAGGTLVLSLGLYLKELALPLPKAIVAFSPCTEQSETLPSHIGNIKTDYMLKDMVSKGLTDVLFEEKVTKEMLKDYKLSPYYGDYENMPPIFLAASDSETLYDDSVILYEKLKNAGHIVELDVQHDVCHAFQMFPMIPEARESLDKCFRFLSEID